MGQSDFSSSLMVEEKYIENANRYYVRNWGALKLERYNYNDKGIGHYMQSKDVDVSVSLPNGRIVNISEKFRTREWGDICIEIYCDGRDGWSIESEATGICYFTPRFCYEVSASAIKELALTVQQKLHDQIVSTVDVCRTNLNGVPVVIRRIENTVEDRSWNSHVVFIKWSDLNRFNITYNRREL